MRSMNWVSTVGIHHIFFPPRLDPSFHESRVDGAAGDRCHRAVAGESFREEIYRPVAVPFRWIGARDGDEAGLLGIVEYGRGPGARGVLQGMREIPGAVPLPYAGDGTQTDTNLGSDLRVDHPTVALQEHLRPFEYAYPTHPFLRHLFERPPFARGEPDDMLFHIHTA